MANLERNRRASIIIPCYNAERFIARTLQSALAQDYAQFDVIVVNDGSTDDTEKIVSGFCNKDPRIRIISTENNGVAAARNVGMRASNAEFVAFLDADDLWVSSKLRLQIETLLSKGDEYAAAYTWSVTIDENDFVLYPNVGWSFDGYILCQHLITWPVGNGSALVVRREAALAMGGFDTEFRTLGSGGTEDLDFELRLAAKYKITCVPDFLVGYRRYTGSMSSDDKRMARAVFLTVSRALERNPGLPRICSRWAWANAYKYAAETSKSLDIVRYMFWLLFLDPHYFLGTISKRTRRVLTRLWRQALAREPQTPPLLRFPHVSVPPFQSDPVIRRRLEKLKRVDEWPKLN